MKKETKTTIAVPNRAELKKLDKHKMYPRETYWDVIKRAIENLGKNNTAQIPKEIIEK